MIKVGREEPAISMDVNGGKIIWAKHSEMQQVNLKALPEGNLCLFTSTLLRNPLHHSKFEIGFHWSLATSISPPLYHVVGFQSNHVT